MCPASPTTRGVMAKGWGQHWQGHGSAPPTCLGMGSGGTVLCPSLQCPQRARLHGRAQEGSVELLPARPSATGSLQGCLWKGTMGQAQGPVHCEPGSSGRLGTKTRKERKEMGFLLRIVSSSCRNRRAHDSAPFCL